MIFTKDNDTWEITLNDASYRYSEMMNDDSLNLKFTLPNYVDFPIGLSTTYDNQSYYLFDKPTINKQSGIRFVYDMVLHTDAYRLKKAKFRELTYSRENDVFGGERRLSFSLTARPSEHLAMIVANMNFRDSQRLWYAGDCIDAPEKVISYDYTDCFSALKAIAQTFETEFEIVGKQIMLHKVVYQGGDFEYDRQNGNIKTINERVENPKVDIVYPQGSDRNIDYSTYNAKNLLLPKGVTILFDGLHFEGEDGYVSTNAKSYTTDNEGYSVKETTSTGDTEEVLDCTDIYPSHVCQVTNVETEGDYYNILDYGVSQNGTTPIDYSQCRIAGEVMSIVFQSGQLSGKEFEIAQDEDTLGYDYATGRFKLCQKEVDGMIMPNSTFPPQVGDTFVVFGCNLPSAYIEDSDHTSGASYEMLRRCCTYLFEHSTPTLNLTIKINRLKDVSAYAKVGTQMNVIDADLFGSDEIVCRVMSFKQAINELTNLEFTLSNTSVSATILDRLKAIEAERVPQQQVQQVTESNEKQMRVDTQRLGWFVTRDGRVILKRPLLFVDEDDNVVGGIDTEGGVGLWMGANYENRENAKYIVKNNGNPTTQTKEIPNIVWNPTIVSGRVGDTWSANTLNAVAYDKDETSLIPQNQLSGTFEYSINGTPIAVGDSVPSVANTYQIHVTFTPDNVSTYTTAEADMMFTITANTLDVSPSTYGFYGNRIQTKTGNITSNGNWTLEELDGSHSSFTLKINGYVRTLPFSGNGNMYISVTNNVTSGSDKTARWRVVGLIGTETQIFKATWSLNVLPRD